MFQVTYKNSLKTLLRSKTFLLSILLVVFVAVYDAIGNQYAIFDMELMELIWDTDPRFVLSFDQYREHIQNACIAGIMWYALPLLAVISTALILSRDWGDRFFEIEKAAGKRPLSYVGARLSAIVSVNVVVMVFAMILSFYWYVISRGGVDGMGFFAMLGDSLPRILRFALFMGVPCVLMYVGLTYAVGNLLKNSIAGAVAGMGYIVAFYVGYLMLSNGGQFALYFSYLSPVPHMTRFYLAAFDRNNPAGFMEMMHTSMEKAAIGIAVLVGVALIYYAVSYWRVRRREY